MKKFTVMIRRDVSFFREIEAIAETEEKAMENAMKMAKNIRAWLDVEECGFSIEKITETK